MAVKAPANDALAIHQVVPAFQMKNENEAYRKTDFPEPLVEFLRR